jgi:hypothetical protein
MGGNHGRPRPFVVDHRLHLAEPSECPAQLPLAPRQCPCRAHYSVVLRGGWPAGRPPGHCAVDPTPSHGQPPPTGRPPTRGRRRRLINLRLITYDRGSESSPPAQVEMLYSDLCSQLHGLGKAVRSLFFPGVRQDDGETVSRCRPCAGVGRTSFWVCDGRHGARAQSAAPRPRWPGGLRQPRSTGVLGSGGTAAVHPSPVRSSSIPGS